MDSEIQEIFNQHGVTLKKASASYMAALNTVGQLSFGKYANREIHVFLWEQTAMCDILDTESQDSGWSLVDTVESTSSVPPSVLDDVDDEARDGFGKSNPDSIENSPAAAPRGSSKQPKISIQVLFRDLDGIEISKTEFRLIGPESQTHSVYQFNHGSPEMLINILEHGGFVRKSTKRKHFYHCVEEGDNLKLQKSFSELNIADIRNRSRQSSLYTDLISKLANVHNQILPLGATRYPLGGNERSNRSSNSGSHSELPMPPSDCNDNRQTNRLIPRPDVHRETPLSAGRWKGFRTPEGTIAEPDKVRSIIFRGGIDPDIRAEVWKYLLGLDVWEHTTDERVDRRANKTQEYFQMKLQWLTITHTQEHNFAGYRERKCQVEKDVKRTDRAFEFFAGDDNPNLSKLQDILMTYIMYNFDLGYVQGMNDLLAPILSLVQHEAESFWCFVGFMQKVFQNFDIDQKGMKQQLEYLRTLLAFVNERLYNYLKDNQSENMYFCFRWLLVWFKREFSNSDIMQLWEILWTGLPCPNFHLFICVAILDQEMDVFIDGKFTFTEILKHVNELSGNLNLQAILEQAESIYLQVKGSLDNSKEPHTELRKLIGEELSPDGNVNGSGTGSDEDDDSCMSILNEKSSEDLEAMQRKVDEACDLSMSYAFF
ncbi:TBC1 domain family member 15 [Uranotaenia lowii]|uniref:TBC1 domain family member 15 n=1 Tax=Uranotaenia lowii TaxID=190385 RepID=UPI0024796417|nr:TBC1 domain family member 15 [Uranotaenia lowii]